MYYASEVKSKKLEVTVGHLISIEEVKSFVQLYRGGRVSHLKVFRKYRNMLPGKMFIIYKRRTGVQSFRCYEFEEEKHTQTTQRRKDTGGSTTALWRQLLVTFSS